MKIFRKMLFAALLAAPLLLLHGCGGDEEGDDPPTLIGSWTFQDRTGAVEGLSAENISTLTSAIEGKFGGLLGKNLTMKTDYSLILDGSAGTFSAAGSTLDMAPPTNVINVSNLRFTINTLTEQLLILKCNIKQNASLFTGDGEILSLLSGATKAEVTITLYRN